ncbi:MAG: hypothetical protein RLZZ362_1491 [Actinomycetota bacterium]|jgi:FkbM family methyltransferase
MTIVSYAQNYEDVMLWRALGHLNDGFFIDVGAAWPTLDSVTRLFHDHGWHGINIEPNPELHGMLVAERPADVNLALALADRSGSMSMEIVGTTGLSTLRTDIAGRYRRDGRQVHTVEVEVSTLADVWSDHVGTERQVHFLKVDVEGFEGEVLAGNDWNANRPWVVVVEATRPTSQVVSIEWEPGLLGNGYRLVYADGINRFYVADEHEELVEAFGSPPNVFDGFTTAAHHTAELVAAEREGQVLVERHRADLAEGAAQKADAHNEWLQGALDACQDRLDTLHESFVDAQRKLGSLEVQLSERDRALANANAHLHGLAQSAESARAATLGMQHAAAEQALLWAEIDRLMATISSLERHIGDMYSSTSWKFAKPVRLASALVHDPRSLARRLTGRSGPGAGELTAAPPHQPDGPDGRGPSRDDGSNERAHTSTKGAAPPTPDLSSAAADLERRLRGSGHEDG